MELVLEAVKKGEFLGTVTGAGLVRIWETRRACSRLLMSKEQDAASTEESARREREVAELGEEVAQSRAEERRFNRGLGEMYGHGHAPLWRVVSGILVGMDLESMHPNERAGRLTLLIRGVERVIRYEWRAFEKLRAERVAGNAPKVDDPRVRWWDPMRVVCEQFGIAHSALSRFAREVTGLAAPDLTDRVKAETVRARMKEDVKAWVLEIYKEEEGNPESELLKADPDAAADLVWSRVTQKRGRGRWSRASWAARFGYSSYTRFQRACLAEYGVSPVELERSVLEDVLRERAAEVSATGAVSERGGESTNCEGRSTTGDAEVGGIEGTD